MLVEDAERYGISQLHQLRGRIGRGEHASLCLLFGPKESPRLKALAAHRDGFELAEIDLELRGEGELIGTRQSGLAQFRVARLPEDAELLEARAGSRAALLESRPRARRARARAARLGARGRLRRRGARPDPGVRVIAGRYGGRRLRRAGGRRDPPHGRPRARGAVLDPRRPRRGRRRARPVRRLGRARARGALARGRARHVRRRRAGRAAGAARQPRRARRGRPSASARTRCAGCAAHARRRANTISSSSTRPTGRRRRWEARSRSCSRRCSRAGRSS